MKKNVKTLLVLIVIMIVIISALLFFIYFQNDKNKFIGTWKAEVNEEEYFTMTFCLNNSLKTVVYKRSNSSTPFWEVNFDYWTTYKLEDQMLYHYINEDISHIGGGRTITYFYRFSENDKKLEMVDDFDKTILIKQ